MNERITPVSLDDTLIGPPTEADVAEIDVPVRKPAKRKPITTRGYSKRPLLRVLVLAPRCKPADEIPMQEPGLSGRIVRVENRHACNATA